jgi:hypothetical protein
MKTFLRNRALPLALLASLVACSVGTGASPPRSGTNSRVITMEQIQANTATNAFDLVRSLRPIWLQQRGTQSLLLESTIVVYQDQVRLGGPETLRAVPTSTISRLEYLDASAATQRWGSGHTHGAILIFTRTI